MSKIQVLDPVTIDMIAAGEVIERPASIVKELTENAMDAGATAIIIEIEEGGISYIRIADNGCGISPSEVRTAFLRHSTSKIRSAEDLLHIHSLGFRGEALSSIAAVSQVEMITKTKEQDYGIRYRIAGGTEEGMEEIGARDGTTFIIRQLFYNTPARRKFLKTPMTEASHISDILTRMALSHPEISIQFINNGQTRIHTSGNGSLKDVIYHLYGRDITSNLLEINSKTDDAAVQGYIGKPLVSRGNRNFEHYYINGRYVKSQILSKAIEDAYKDYTMQHKYPFTALMISIPGDRVDVNVHPAKMEVRFQKQQEVYELVYEAVRFGLKEKELIPQVELEEPREIISKPAEKIKTDFEAAHSYAPDSEKSVEKMQIPQKEERDLNYFMGKMRERVAAYHNRNSSAEVAEKSQIFKPETQTPRIREAAASPAKQLDLFEEKLLDREIKAEYRLIGQVFDTYWMVEFHENLYIIDQHAAHERVLYERTLREMKHHDFTSQYISPPIILNLNMQEAHLLRQYIDQFTRIGFEFEDFGQDSFAVRAVPGNLFGIAKKELLMQMIDGLTEDWSRSLTPELVDEKIASMSCKAAVKGNMKLSAAEVDALISELLLLENPYHCPHGRPTIIAMSRRELEKKFKRIV